LTSLKSASGPQSDSSTVISAVNALLVPEEFVIPNICPSSPFVAEESNGWRTLLLRLGAKEVKCEDYIGRDLLPLIKTPSDHVNRYKALRRILVFICSDEKWVKSHLATMTLFPNRNGELCRATDLYDPSERLFAESFAGDGSQLPHSILNINDLRKVGLNTVITKADFRVCLECLEREYQSGVRGSLCERARYVWRKFCDRPSAGFPEFTRSDIAALSNYHFVTVHQYKAGTPSYRDAMPLPGSDTRVLATIREIADPEYIAVEWTQRFLPESPPASWIKNFCDISPTDTQVVKHLVHLATVIAPKCDLSEDDFFKDLKATYEHLSRPDCIQAVGALLTQRYPNAPVWLNEDVPLEHSYRRRDARRSGREERKDTVDSLLWLPAKRIVQGISYDASDCNIVYGVKVSIQPYQNLLRCSGMNILRQVEAPLLPGNGESHSDTILQSLRSMRDSEALCDMIIIIGDQKYPVHRAVMAIFSSVFRTLAGSQNWKESQIGILDLNSENAFGPSGGNNQSCSARPALYGVKSVES
jgi:BTB/POZ domain